MGKSAIRRKILPVDIRIKLLQNRVKALENSIYLREIEKNEAIRQLALLNNAIKE